MIKFSNTMSFQLSVCPRSATLTLGEELISILGMAQIQESDAIEYAQMTDFDQANPYPSFNCIDPMCSLSGNGLATRNSTPTPPNPLVSHTLPAYLKPFPQHLTADEIHILVRKSALFIPENAFRNQLLGTYIEHVHPYMPLIDIHEFLRIIDGNGQSGRMSLMLFQAVMFAGTAFIEVDHLYAAGFANRREAQMKFYQRCRVGL